LPEVRTERGIGVGILPRYSAVSRLVQLMILLHGRVLLVDVQRRIDVTPAAVTLGERVRRYALRVKGRGVKVIPLVCETGVQERVLGIDIVVMTAVAALEDDLVR
jgi:hypothetical protein